METRKVLSSLCYFSIFFAGFIFPLVVYLAANDDITKKHAKKAFLSHLIPLIPLPLLGISIYYDITGMTERVPVFAVITAVLMGLVSLVVVIWNIVKGVKVLRAE